MERPDKNEQNTNNETKEVKSANKPNNKKKVSDGLSARKKKNALSLKKTRGQQKAPKKYINFLHLQELCCDHGYGNLIEDISNEDIASCINKLGEKYEISITSAAVGKYKSKKIGVSAEKLQLYAAAFDVNPDYLIENGSNIKKLFTSTVDIYSDDKHIGQKEIYINDNFIELQKIITAKKLQKIMPLIQIASILGYSFESENDNIYLQIPDAEKEKISENIPLYEQWLDKTNRIKITDASFDYIMLQLQSAVDLFKATLNNYFASDLAQIIIIDDAHSKPHSNKMN